MLLGLRTAFLGPFTPITPAVAGLEAGFLARGNWAAGAAVAVPLAAAWALTPAAVTPPTVFYVAAVAVIFAARRRLELHPDRLDGRSFGRALAVAYVANITRHAFGSLLLAPLMAVEQASFAIATALVAVPALKAVSKRL